ncbi:peptidoglycan lipid II flippase [Pycnococcus provasolii]
MACTTPPPSSSLSSSSSGVVVRTSHSHSRSRSYFQHDSSRRRCTPPPFSFYLVSAIHSTSRSRKQLAACSSHDDGFKEGLPRHDSIFTRRRDLSQGSRLGASSRWLNIPHSSAGRGRRRRPRGASHATTSSSTSPPSPSSLAKSTYLVAVFAALAKFVAVFREVLIAFAFGVGPIADAFGYASMMPSFFVAVLGGINGPLHSAVAGQLSRAKKHQEEEEEEEVPASDVVASASAASLLLTAPVAVLTFAFAPQIFDALAPGLAASATADAQLARSAGATMLRVMSPTVLLCGPLGVCFGALSANGGISAARGKSRLVERGYHRRRRSVRARTNAGQCTHGWRSRSCHRNHRRMPRASAGAGGAHSPAWPWRGVESAVWRCTRGGAMRGEPSRIRRDVVDDSRRAQLRERRSRPPSRDDRDGVGADQRRR